MMRPNELARMPSTRGSRGKRAPPATAILTTQANAAMPPSHDLSNCRHYSTLGEARMGVKAVSGASPSTVRRALLLDIFYSLGTGHEIQFSSVPRTGWPVYWGESAMVAHREVVACPA